MLAPTAEEMLDEIGLKEVHRDTTSGWRHGTDEYVVWHREADDTYWSACFRVSTDGEFHGLRAEYGDKPDYTSSRVIPVEKTVIRYDSVDNDYVAPETA